MKFNSLYPELIVRQLELSEQFYVAALGFTVEYRRPEEHFVFLSYGHAQIMLLQDNLNQHSRTGDLQYPRGQGINLSIETPDATRIAQQLQAGGYPLRIQPRDQWHRKDNIEIGERQVWVMDPDGYLLRFIEALGTRAISKANNAIH